MNGGSFTNTAPGRSNMIPSGSIHLTSRRVLLIENSPGDRKLLRTWLNTEMIDTFEAVDIMTGLAACQKYLPNLILLQLRLNTWDGFEVIRRLKDDPRTRSIPVIFLANSALTAEKAKGIDMGAVDFVSQPYDSVELLARVHSALRTKALLDLLEQRAHLDGLTELGNRFALQQMIPQTMEACIQANAPLSIVIADLDHFKKVNDQYGHAAGDEILRRFSMILRHSTRQTDFLARYGGEEFVVLCPNCDLANALEIAERIRTGVAEHPVAFRNATIKVTASLGVLSTSALAGEDPRTLVDRADQALYRAKATGRNAVWLWDVTQNAPVPAVANSATIDPGKPLERPEALDSDPALPRLTPASDPEPTLDTSSALLPLKSSKLRDDDSNDADAKSDSESPNSLEAQGRSGQKLGVARREPKPARPEAPAELIQEPFPWLQPLNSIGAPDPDTRPVPKSRATAWGAGNGGETAAVSASSSEIEALWGVSSAFTLDQVKPSPPEPPRTAASLFQSRIDPPPPAKSVNPPKRVGNGPPPPPPRPRVNTEVPSSSGQKSD